VLCAHHGAVLTKRRARAQSHPALVAGVVDLATRVQADSQLAALVRRKFAIKCTTGYSLNALVDFPLSDPVEIIKRLLIGSEGTLGFVSQATYNTVPEWPHKARRPALPPAAPLRRAASDNRTVASISCVPDVSGRPGCLQGFGHGSHAKPRLTCKCCDRRPPLSCSRTSTRPAAARPCCATTRPSTQWRCSTAPR